MPRPPDHQRRFELRLSRRPGPHDARPAVRSGAHAALAMAVAVLLAAMPHSAWAQSTRSLAMGGVRLGLETPNPAAVGLAPAGPGGASEIPLPLGVIGVIMDPRMAFGSADFDPLTAIDRLSKPLDHLFAPAASPDEIAVVREGDEAGAPFRVVFRGGSNLAIAAGPTVRIAERAGVTWPLPAGPISVSVRPYARVDGVASARRDFFDMLAGASETGTVDIAGAASAGIELGVAGALPVPVPQEEFPGVLFVGARLTGFAGLASYEAEGTAAVTVEAGTSEATVALEADLFTGGLLAGGTGYGVGGDVGIAGKTVTPDGSATFGMSVANLGLEVWSGEVRHVADDGQGNVVWTSPQPETRVSFGDGVSVYLHGAYEPALASLGLPAMSTLLIASDIETDFRLVRAHVGIEAGFTAGTVELLGRAGAGLDGGLVAGVGGGLRAAGVGLDVALHAYRPPLTLDTAIGVRAGLVLLP